MLKDKRTAMVGTLVVVLFLSLLTFTTPGKALAAYECNLSVEGEKQGKIEGGSTSKKIGVRSLILTFDMR